MGMVVRTNTMAQNAFRQLNVNNNAVSKSLEKLSSGFRINRAGDDAAGLAISEKMKAQIKGLETASSNAQDGISLIQTAEGALNEVHNMLNRMVELATKSANGTYSTTEREALQNEVDSLLEEIDRISESTNFNGINLLDGSMGFNADAFSVNGVDAVKGTAVELDKTDTATSGFARYADNDAPTDAEKIDLHFTKDGSQVAPSFKIDLADLNVKVAESTDADERTFSLTLTGDGKKVEDGTSTALANTNTLDVTLTAGEYDGAQLAQKIQAAYATDGFNYQGANYTVKVTGSELEFVFNAPLKTDADTVDTDNKGVVNGETASPSGTVAVTATVGSGTAGAVGAVVTVTSGAQMHDTIDVVNPIKPEAGGRAGITFELDTAKVVEDGNRLTIDGTTFVFKTSKESAAAAGKGEILIDVSDKTTDADRIAEAADLMSRHSTANFEIEAKNDTDIHIDQKVNNQNVYADRDSLTGLFSMTKGAAAAGTAVTLTQDQLQSGNSLSIGGKVYTFGDNVSIGADGTATMNNLKAALYADGYTSQVSGSTLTVYSKDADAKVGPSVIGGGLTLQIGDTGEKFNQMTVTVADMSAKGIGVNGLDITTQEGARNSIDTIKSAINAVSSNRAAMGAMQNRLEYTINNLDTAVENMSAANSRIRDTDMAKEMMNYTQMNILTQAAQAMLAQANQQPQAILQLLQ